MTTTEQMRRDLLVDGARSVIEASVEELWGLHTLRGRFDRFVGAYTTGPDGPHIDVTIDASSVDTGNAARDALIRSEGFLDAELHPHVRFTSTSVVPRGDGTARIEGELEAAGKTAPVAFDATLRAAGGEIVLEVSTQVDIGRLGARGPLGAIGSTATVHVKLVFA